MTGKRPYRLGKRQASVNETKSRIIEAAVAEYGEKGIEDTSMQAVARRADVAPGTVLYHYSTPDDLVEAVVESWIGAMDAPSPATLVPDASLSSRIAALVTELFGLYERSGSAYGVYVKSPAHPILKRYEKWWFDNVNQMMVRALGERASEMESMQVVSVLVNPGFRGTLLSSGISPRRAEELTTQMILGYLEG